LLDEGVVEAHGTELAGVGGSSKDRASRCYWSTARASFLHGNRRQHGPVFYLVEPACFRARPHGRVPTDRTARTLAYIVSTSRASSPRAILYAFLASLRCAARHGAYRRRGTKALLPMAGAVAYMAGSFFVMPAADARYNFWPNWSSW
jgi:hypothetical protein